MLFTRACMHVDVVDMVFIFSVSLLRIDRLLPAHGRIFAGPAPDRIYMGPTLNS